MAQQQLPIHVQVEELTVFLGKVKDDGNREVFVAYLVEGKRHQARKPVASWVEVDKLLTYISSLVYEVESGARMAWELAQHLEGMLEAAEDHPF